MTALQPLAAGDETPWEQGTALTATISDVVTAANIDDAVLQGASEQVGYALLGISLGDAWSTIQDGDVEGGLGKLATLLGETAVGLTTYGPVYALQKLLQQTTVGMVTGNLEWAVEQRYADYKALRTRGIMDNLDRKQLAQFVAWTKQGRPAFTQFAANWVFDGAALIHYRLEMQAERVATYGFFDQVQHNIWPFSDGAQQYQADKAWQPTEAEIKEHIYRRWEARVVMEVLQDIAQKKLALARQAANNTRLLVTGLARDGDGAPLTGEVLGLRDGAGDWLAWGDPPVLSHALGIASDHFSFTIPFTELVKRAGDETIRLVWRDRDLDLGTMQLNALLRQKGRTMRSGATVYLVRDVGPYSVTGAAVTVTVQPTGAAATSLTMETLDPLFRVISQAWDQASGTLTARVQVPAGQPVAGRVEATVNGQRVHRPLQLTVPPAQTAAALPVDITPRTSAAPVSASAGAIIAAMTANQSAVLAGTLSYGEFSAANAALYDRFGSQSDDQGFFRDRLARARDDLDQAVMAQVRAEIAALRTPADGFTDRVRALQDQLALKSAAATDLAEALPSASDWLYPMRRRLERFEPLASQYDRLLADARSIATQLTALQDEFKRAIDPAIARWTLLSASREPATLITAANAQAQKLRDSLAPLLARHATGYVRGLRARKAVLEKARDTKMMRSGRLIDQTKAAQATLEQANATVDSLVSRLSGWSARGFFADLEVAQQALMELARPPRAESVRIVADGSAALDRVNTLLGRTIAVGEPARGTGNPLGFLERLRPWQEFAAAQLDPLWALEAGRLSETGQTDEQLPLVFDGIAAAADFTDADFSLQVNFAERARDYLAPLRAAGDTFVARRATLRERWPRANAIAMAEGSAVLRAAKAALARLEPEQPAQPAQPQPVRTATSAGVRITLQLNSVAAAVDGVPQTLERPLPVRGGRTLVPVRLLGDAIGALVTWDAGESKVTYRSGRGTVEIWVGRAAARVDGRAVTVDPPPEIVAGRTYVPLRFVAEALGATVNWDGATSQITIEYGK